MHFGLLILVGDVVIIQGALPNTTFVAVPYTEEASEEILLPEESTQDSPEATSSDLPEQAVSATTPLSPTPDIMLTPTLSSNQIVALPASMPEASAAGAMSGSPSDQNSAASKSGDVRNMASFFGTKREVADGLTGYLYDLKQTSERKPTDMAELPNEKATASTKENVLYHEAVKEFISTWNPNKLRGFYRSKDPLSTFQIFLTLMMQMKLPRPLMLKRMSNRAVG